MSGKSMRHNYGERGGRNKRQGFKLPSWCFAAVRALRRLFLLAAFAFALLPTVLKMYETSHWFREYGDPSQYDKAKDWFDNPGLPFQQQIDNPKVLMRVYFFVLPYVAMAVCLVMARGLSAIPEPQKYHQAPNQIRKGSFRLLHRHLPFPSWLVNLGAPESVTVGEVLGVSVFLLLNFMTIGVRVRRSLPRGTRKNLYLVDEGDAGKEPIPGASWPAAEVWGKTLGVIAIVNLGWYLLMPIGKKSVLLEALGLSWSRAVKYHRWVGFYTFLIFWAHGLLYVLVLMHGNGHPAYDPEGTMLRHNLVAWGCNDCDADQLRLLRVNIYGIVTLLLCTVITVFALPYFRRYHFEWFFYVHQLFVLVLFFVCLHYKGAILYLIPGVAIFSIDKILGWQAYKNSAVAETTMVSPDVLEVSFALPKDVRYQAGQYVLVNVPEVSHLEWHPYSITSSPSAHPGRLFFHVKEAGAPDSWTRKVIEAGRSSSSCGESHRLKMRIDAFYGDDHVPELGRKTAVVLIGGGIGVTPMLGLATELVHQSNDLPVTLLWVCRTVEEFHIFSEDLYRAQVEHPNLTVKVWITLGPEIRRTILDAMTTEEEKFAHVRGLIESHEKQQEQAKEERQVVRKPASSNQDTCLFRTTPPGLEPLGNALAMLIAMVFALTGYTTSVDLSRERGVEHQGVKTLLDMALVVVMILLVLVVIVIARRRRSKKQQASESSPRQGAPTQKKNPEESEEEEEEIESDLESPDDRSSTDQSQTDSNIEGSNTEESHTEESNSTESSESNTSDDDSIPVCDSVGAESYKTMLFGRIGCYPNMEDEFAELAEKHRRPSKHATFEHTKEAKANAEDSPSLDDDVGVMDSPSLDDDVGVMACGPQAMIRSIRTALHNTGPWATFFDAGRIANPDGSDAVFHFAEEEWEW